MLCLRGKCLVLRVHRHDPRSQRGTHAASDALLAVDGKPNAPARIDEIALERTLRELIEREHGPVVPVLDHLLRVREVEPVAVADARPNEQHRRPQPGRERIQLERVHHDRRGAHVDRREPSAHHIARAAEIGVPDIHRNHGLYSERRHGGGQIVDCPAVLADAAADRRRRKESGQRARRVHRVPNGDVLEPREPPHHDGPSLEIHGVDEELAAEPLKGALGRDRVDEIAQRLLEVERRRARAVDDHPHAIQAKEVALGDLRCAALHLVERNVRDTRRRDECADARARIASWHDAALLERAHDPDVREALEPSATQHEGRTLRTEPGHRQSPPALRGKVSPRASMGARADERWSRLPVRPIS